MKKFRNFFLMAAVALVGFSSCNNNENYNPAVEGEGYLAISLGGVITPPDLRAGAASGTIEAPGTGLVGEITLTHARVFVVNSIGAVTHTQEISTVPGEITVLSENGANLLNQRVQLTDRIFVVANTPAAQQADLAALPNLDAINEFTSAITTQANHTTVVLANVNRVAVPVSSGAVVTGDGLPQGTPNPAGAELRHVNVRVNPVISRLELHDVNSVEGWHPTTRTVTRNYFDAAGNPIGAPVTQVETIQGRFVGWTLTGVFVDNTFANFTYGGFGTEARFLGMRTAPQVAAHLAANEVPYYVVGSWPADPATMIARPNVANNDVWAFNVASGLVYAGGTALVPGPGVTQPRHVPRLIIRLENISWLPHPDYDWRIDDNGDPITGDPVAANNFGAPIPITANDGVRFITVTGYTGVPVFERGNIYRIGTTVPNSDGFTFTLDDIYDIIVINPEDVNVRVRIEIQPWRLVSTTPFW